MFELMLNDNQHEINEEQASAKATVMECLVEFLTVHFNKLPYINSLAPGKF